MRVKSDEVVIDLDNTPGQLFTRIYIYGVTVLIDATPQDDPNVQIVHRMLCGMTQTEQENEHDRI